MSGIVNGVDPEFVERIKATISVKSLGAELQSINRILRVEELFPMRNKDEIEKLKRQRIIIQCQAEHLERRAENGEGL